MSYITCRLYGGLANQLWQVGSTIGTAIANQLPYKIPVQTGNPLIYPYYFNGWNLPRFKFPPDKVKKFYHEKAQTCQHIPVTRNKALCMDGYWQSVNYFRNHMGAVLDALNPVMLSVSQHERDAMQGYVGIHVRRGDYTGAKPANMPDHWKPVAGIYPVTQDYLLEAVRTFIQAGATKFRVFSDDIAWCKEALKNKKYPLYEFSEDKNAMQDMALLASCDGFVLSYSTFSMWAVFFSRKYDNAIAVMPHALPGLIHLEESIPRSWVRL